MLPAVHRLTDGAAFSRAVRQGRRAGSTTLVVHLAVPESPDGAPARVGLVVSRAVGNAVVRNRVKRRIRHLTRDHLAVLPGSAVLVVRALPPAATAETADLAADLRRCLDRASRPRVSA